MEKTKNSSVEERVIEILSKYLKIDKSEIKLDQKLSTDLGVDSFGKFEVTFDIQKAFSIDIEDSDLAKIETVGDVIRAIEKRGPKS